MKLKNILPPAIYKIIINIYNRFFNSFINKSYSQEGEDLILKRIFGNKKQGFFVDVGAHHPKRFSNTYLFYKSGWKGINIEPRPGTKKEFDRVRGRDINIEAAIGNTSEELMYYMFEEPALNTFSQEQENSLIEDNKSKLIKKIKIRTATLKDILDKELPSNTQIDFLSIDTEGFDLNVLKSNDWNKYKPDIILVEDKDFGFKNPNSSKVFNFLVEKNYAIIAKTYKTLFFQLQ